MHKGIHIPQVDILITEIKDQWNALQENKNNSTAAFAELEALAKSNTNIVCMTLCLYIDAYIC